jgi:hypothetical protein
MLLTEIKLPLDEELSEKGKWHDIPENFVDLLKFASNVCSRNVYDGKLTCIHVNTEKGHIESSDNFRVLRCFTGKIPISTFLLPYTSADIIYRTQPIKIAEGKGWIHFKTKESTIISCRTFNEAYVNTEPYLKMEKNAIQIKLPTSLGEVLDRAIIFAKRDKVIEENVDIDILRKIILIQSNSESSWFKEMIPINFAGDSLSFSVTPYLLKDIISQTSECELFEKRLKFKGKNWIYITNLRG